MIERTGVSLQDYLNSAKELKESLPNHEIVMSIFIHNYFDPVANEYVFPLIVGGNIIKKDIKKRKVEAFGSIYERILDYCDIDKLEQTESRVLPCLEALTKYAKDLGLTVTNVPQFPKDYERFSANHPDVFEVYDIPDKDFNFAINAAETDQRLGNVEQ